MDDTFPCDLFRYRAIFGEEGNSLHLPVSFMFVARQGWDGGALAGIFLQRL